MADTPLPATTTTQQDLSVAGQRRINLIWETTQAVIAVGITAAVIWLTAHAIESRDLLDAFFVVIGFYFSRTNHAAIGGIGHKPQAPYEGR